MKTGASSFLKRHQEELAKSKKLAKEIEFMDYQLKSRGEARCVCVPIQGAANIPAPQN